MQTPTYTLRLAGCAVLLACAACGSADPRTETSAAPSDAAETGGAVSVTPAAGAGMGAIRDLLFGDVPLKEWAASGAKVQAEPWTSFVRANEVIEAGKPTDALTILLGITKQPGLETRHYLQAYSALRTHLGSAPGAPEGNQVLGVVVEVQLEQGLDVVAAYADHRARYINQAGGGIVWEAGDSSMNASIDQMIAAGRGIAERFAPLDTPHPPPPPPGQARVSVLTPRGIRTGQGAMDELMRDPSAGPAVRAAFDVMTGLMAKAQNAPR